MSATEQAFAGWLSQQGFAEQTSRLTLVQFRRLEAHAGGEPAELAQPHMRWYVARVLAFDQETKKLPPKLRAYAEAVMALVAKPKKVRGGHKGKTRKRPTRSVDDAAWQRLVAALATDETGPGRVLNVQAATALRIGDLLRIPAKELARARKTGKLELTAKGDRQRVLHVDAAPEAWTKLMDLVAGAKGAENVASAISASSDSSSSGAAYQACRRHLRELATKLDIDRLPTHRIRRTLAVQALRITQDTQAVGELLGHAPGSTATLHYIDEARSEHVADLTKKIRSTFAKKGPTA